MLEPSKVAVQPSIPNEKMICKWPCNEPVEVGFASSSVTPQPAYWIETAGREFQLLMCVNTLSAFACWPLHAKKTGDSWRKRQDEIRSRRAAGTVMTKQCRQLKCVSAGSEE
mmetsp:Transcript_112361/g.194884  ORF Transcript_112361/g.194884 Transcript_112361/m.194884 type:complete len:112 (+) Transcript_112361:633-968(+)